MLEKLEKLFRALIVPLVVLIVGFGAIAIFGEIPSSQDTVAVENNVPQMNSAPTGVPRVYVSTSDVTEDSEAVDTEELTDILVAPEGDLLVDDESVVDEPLSQDCEEIVDEDCEEIVDEDYDESVDEDYDESGNEGDEEVVEVADLSQVVFEFDDVTYVFEEVPMYANLSLAENLCLILYEDPHTDIIEFFAWLEVEQVVEVLGDMDGTDEFIEALELYVPSPENPELFLAFMKDYLIPMG